MNLSGLKQFVEQIVAKLFESQDRRIDRLVTELDKKNREIKNYQVEGFLLQGQAFVPKNARYAHARGTSRNSLSFTLQEEGNELLVEKRTLDHDRKIIEQFLYKTLYHCQNAQEVRDTIPQCLIQFSPQLQKMEQRSSIGFYAPKDPRYLREAEKIIPRIEYYSVLHLMY